MKTKYKGNLAVGQAISRFLFEGYTVSLPLNDSQKYDIIIDNGKLEKIQCKYTSSKPKESKSYRVGLRIITGYRKKELKMVFYQKGDFDKLFVFCSDKSQYLIPFSELKGKCEIAIGKNMQKYRL